MFERCGGEESMKDERNECDRRWKLALRPPDFFVVIGFVLIARLLVVDSRYSIDLMDSKTRQ